MVAIKNFAVTDGESGDASGCEAGKGVCVWRFKDQGSEFKAQHSLGLRLMRKPLGV